MCGRYRVFWNCTGTNEFFRIFIRIHVLLSQWQNERTMPHDHGAKGSTSDAASVSWASCTIPRPIASCWRFNIPIFLPCCASLPSQLHQLFVDNISHFETNHNTLHHNHMQLSPLAPLIGNRRELTLCLNKNKKSKIKFESPATLYSNGQRAAFASIFFKSYWISEWHFYNRISPFGSE